MIKLNVEKIKIILNKRTSINSKTDCWEYQGTNKDGYGQVMIDGLFYYTHVLSTIIHFNYVPTNGLMICHKDNVCKNKVCWNPEHIYIGDASYNNEDIRKAGNAHGRFTNATHCVNGHELTSRNTYWSKRKDTGEMRRQCRTCRSIRTLQYRHRQKAKLLALKIS